MEIVNLTEDKGILNGLEYSLKPISYNSSVTFEILCKNTIFKDIRVGCGVCTTVKHSQIGNDLKITITYTPNRGGSKGDFKKSITINQTTRLTFKGKSI